MKFLCSCLEIGRATRTPAGAHLGALPEPRLHNNTQAQKAKHHKITSVIDSYPVSFDAHITFEAREAIFTLYNREGENQTRCRDGKKEKKVSLASLYGPYPGRTRLGPHSASHIGFSKSLVRTNGHGNSARLWLPRSPRDHSKYSLHPILAARQDHKSGPM